MSARPVKMILSDLGEFGLIGFIDRKIGKCSRALKGIGDDTAVIPLSSRKYLLFTTDMLREGIHFTRKMPAQGIGHKALACNISDIAAMGGIPQYAVVSLGAPGTCPQRFISGIYDGIRQTAKKFGVEIVGGDTIKCKEIIINVALTGEVGKKHVIYRSGARCGDHIFVTGPLGNSLSSGWHLNFVPRVKEAQYLVKKFRPTAMIDVSDGLAADLGHILSESRVGAVIEEDLIPRRKGASLKQALHDGEDFELLFTLPAAKAKAFESCGGKNFKSYRIGQVVDDEFGLQLRTEESGLKTVKGKGYTHF